MSQIPKLDRYGRTVAHIHEVVERHRLPDFVTGVDVRLGDFDGDPALWVAVRLAHGIAAPGPERAALESARKAVFDDLLEEIEDRCPYSRFQVRNDRPASLS